MYRVAGCNHRNGGIKLMFFHYRHHLVLLVNLHHSIMFMLVGVDQAQVILMMNKHLPPGNGLGCPYGKFLAGPPGPGPGLKVEGSLQAVVLVVIQEVFLMGGPPSSGSGRQGPPPGRSTSRLWSTGALWSWSSGSGGPCWLSKVCWMWDLMCCCRIMCLMR